MDFEPERLSRWFATHHGIVTRSRARWLGMTDAMIDGKVRRSEWVVMSRGVYAVASSQATPGRTLLAAVAACGPGACASHLSAAWLWGLLPDPPTEAWITAGAGCRRALPDVVVHRTIDEEVPVLRHGLPCTQAVRTLIDCASVVPPSGLAELVDQGLAARAFTIPTLLAALDTGRSASRRPGRGALRAVLRQRGHLGGPPPSVLESRMSRLLAGLGIPLPQREVRWAGAGRSGGCAPAEYRLDFAWPEHRLAVEVDGYSWHSSPERMRRDQRRRNDLVRAGWTVLVYTWRDVVEEPGRVGQEVRAAYLDATAGRRRPA